MKRWARSFAVCLLGLLGPSLSWAATPDDCHTLRKHGHRADAQKCYESLTAVAREYSLSSPLGTPDARTL